MRNTASLTGNTGGRTPLQVDYKLLKEHNLQIKRVRIIRSEN